MANESQLYADFATTADNMIAMHRGFAAVQGRGGGGGEGGHGELQDHEQRLINPNMMWCSADDGASSHHHHHHHHLIAAPPETKHDLTPWQHGGGRLSLSLHNPDEEEEGVMQLKRSRYMVAAMELLNEFCSIGNGNEDIIGYKKNSGGSHWEQLEAAGGGHPPSSSSSSASSMNLCSMDILQIQKRKTRLFSMLEEVDRRYSKYCEQMRSVAWAFESAAGVGLAAAYTAMASRAMSRHFRCLRDSIAGQIRATRAAMGEKEPVAAPGTTRGETPRLRMLDQCLRHRKAAAAFQYLPAGPMGTSSSSVTADRSHHPPWRPQRGLPERSVSVLRAWLFEHFLHPYPSDVDKHILARQTGLSRSQVSNWFINARVRLWKPMVEEIYSEEVKDQQDNNSDGNPNPNAAGRPDGSSPSMAAAAAFSAGVNDVDTDESLSSVVISSRHQRISGGGGGAAAVSLTLCLQQHGGGSTCSPHSSVFLGGSGGGDCQLPVQFSFLDDGEVQNDDLVHPLQGFKNNHHHHMGGAQLLHDWAGWKTL